jgi:hypothetical protein
VSDLQTGVIESPGMAITDDIARLVAIMVRQHQGQRAATLRRAVYGDTPPTACPGSRRHAGPAPASSRRGRTAPPPPRPRRAWRGWRICTRSNRTVVACPRSTSTSREPSDEEGAIRRATCPWRLWRLPRSTIRRASVAASPARTSGRSPASTRTPTRRSRCAGASTAGVSSARQSSTPPTLPAATPARRAAPPRPASTTARAARTGCVGVRPAGRRNHRPARATAGPGPPSPWSPGHAPTASHPPRWTRPPPTPVHRPDRPLPRTAEDPRRRARRDGRREPGPCRAGRAAGSRRRRPLPGRPGRGRGRHRPGRPLQDRLRARGSDPEIGRLHRHPPPAARAGHVAASGADHDSSPAPCRWATGRRVGQVCRVRPCLSAGPASCRPAPHAQLTVAARGYKHNLRQAA